MNNFKKALKTTALFLVILTILNFLITEPYFASENDFYQDAKEREALAGSVDYVVIGASHSFRAFKPDVLDEGLGVNSYNLSCSDMTTAGRYELLSLELERNPVDTVVFEVSFDTIRRDRDVEGLEGDLYMISRLGSMRLRVPYFFKNIRLREYVQTYYFYLEKTVKYLKKIPRGKFAWENQSKRVYKGYAAYLDDDREAIDTDYEKIYNTYEFGETICEDNVKDVEKCIQLCKSKGIRVILVTVPISKSTMCSSTNLDVFREWYAAYAAENDLEFYDFNLLKNRDELFYDEVSFQSANHLSDVGAQTFSECFVDVMKMVDAGEDVSSLFFKTYKEYDQSQEYAKAENNGKA